MHWKLWSWPGILGWLYNCHTGAFLKLQSQWQHSKFKFILELYDPKIQFYCSKGFQVQSIFKPIDIKYHLKTHIYNKSTELKNYFFIG